VTVPFRLTLTNADGFITSSQLYPSEREANVARQAAVLLPGEVIKQAPEPQAHRVPSVDIVTGEPVVDRNGGRLFRVERISGNVFENNRAIHGSSPEGQAILARARAIQLTLRPFVLIDITGGIVQSEYIYAGEGKPTVHVIDTDLTDQDADDIEEAAHRFMDIASEWQLYVDALTDEVEQARDQQAVLELRDEADSLLDDAQGMTLIAGQLFDNATGQETNR
jgi:hypothetical protein